MNFSKYTLGISFGLAISGFGLAVAPAQAISFGPVQIDGAEYNITTVEGSFAAPEAGATNSEGQPVTGFLQSRLEAQPWWGNSDLARQLATQVRDTLGFGNAPFNVGTANPNNEGPYFAFKVNYKGNLSAWNWDTDLNHGAGGVELDNHNNGPNENLIWAVANPVPSATTPTAVPTPALLPALLGFGVNVVRRRRKQLESEASV